MTNIPLDRKFLAILYAAGVQQDAVDSLMAWMKKFVATEISKTIYDAVGEEQTKLLGSKVAAAESPEAVQSIMDAYLKENPAAAAAVEKYKAERIPALIGEMEAKFQTAASEEQKTAFQYLMEQP